MYKKILSDLENVDISNAATLKLPLRKLQADVNFCLKRKDYRGLKIISSAINDFLSANKSKFDIERQNNPSYAYRIKMFINELIAIANKCEII